MKVVIIKEYSGKVKGKDNYILSGEERDGEKFWDDVCKRMLKEAGKRNTGRFIVLLSAGGGIYISEFPRGIHIGDGSTVSLYDRKLLVEALQKLEE